MQYDLINQGLALMLAGMGTVFVFLTTLVVAMSIMSRLLMWLQPATSDPGITDDEVAAVTAAIAAHRRK